MKKRKMLFGLILVIMTITNVSIVKQQGCSNIDLKSCSAMTMDSGENNEESEDIDIVPFKIVFVEWFYGVMGIE